MNDSKTFDELIGFGKPASKTADWIVNTYLPNAPVSYRLSIEHAIAQAIVDAHPGIVPGWVQELDAIAYEAGQVSISKANLTDPMRDKIAGWSRRIKVLLSAAPKVKP